MRPILSFLLLLAVGCYTALAQQRAQSNIWLIDGAPDSVQIIDFNSNPPRLKGKKSSNIETILGTFTSISDTTGNLLFASNGGRIVNKEIQILPHGDSIYDHSDPNGVQNQLGYAAFGINLPQGALLLPDPGSPYLYHHFSSHITETTIKNLDFDYTSHLMHSVIDIRLDSGRGDVVLKNNVLYSDTLANGMLTACRHANGRDWWLLTPRMWKTTFLLWRITPQGIEPPIEQSFDFYKQYPVSYFGPLSYFTKDIFDTGITCFSPDGTRFARQAMSKQIELYDFDRETGKLTAKQQFYSPEDYKAKKDTLVCTGWGAVAFSPSGRYIYSTTPLPSISAFTSGTYQFDVEAADIAASAYLMGHYPQVPPELPYGVGLPLLSSNGKMYIIGGTTYKAGLDEISYPDKPAAECGYKPRFLNYEYQGNGFTPINFCLGAKKGSKADSLGLAANYCNITTDSVIFPVLLPNPVRGTLTIQWAATDAAQSVFLYNVLGQEILHIPRPEQLTESQVSVANLATGLYFYRAHTNKHYHTGKLVVE